MARGREIVLLCPAGFEHLVASAARDDVALADATASPGFVRGRTTASVKALRALSYASNLFHVATSVSRSSLAQELTVLATLLPRTPRPSGLPEHGAFRLRLSDDGRFVTTATKEAYALAASAAQWSGLRLDPRGGHQEFWVIRRREADETVFGIKLVTRRAAPPPKGSLRMEIASSLVRLANVGPNDVVLDPFAGSGAIGLAALETSARNVWLNDIDTHSLALVRPRRGLASRITLTHVDFRQLPVQRAMKPTRIVTDPPWGSFETLAEPIEDFYRDLGRVIEAMLSPGTEAVVLTGAPRSAVDALTSSLGLGAEASFSVLVNGKKARVLRIRRLDK